MSTIRGFTRSAAACPVGAPRGGRGRRQPGRQRGGRAEEEGPAAQPRSSFLGLPWAIFFCLKPWCQGHQPQTHPVCPCQLPPNTHLNPSPLNALTPLPPAPSNPRTCETSKAAWVWKPSPTAAIRTWDPGEVGGGYWMVGPRNFVPPSIF